MPKFAKFCRNQAMPLSCTLIKTAGVCYGRIYGLLFDAHNSL